MSNNQKDLRKQLRNIIQDMKDELINQELVSVMEKRLDGAMRVRLEALDKMVRDRLNEIDSRSRDIQNFIMRQNLASGQPAPQVEGVDVTAAPKQE